MRRTLGTAFSCLAIAAGLCLPLVAHHVMVGVNLSASLPGKALLLKRRPAAEDLTRGRVVAFRIPPGTALAFGYPVRATWAKRIAGVPGETVSVDAARNVSVGGRAVGRARTKSSSGLALTPVRDGLVIPEGSLFVAGTHADSLDSRYGIFGLVPFDRVLAVSFDFGQPGWEDHP